VKFYHLASNNTHVSYCEHVIQSHRDTYGFLRVPILDEKPCHVPLICKCPIEKSGYLKDWFTLGVVSRKLGV
jgi:hypothetical protein